MKKFQNLIGEGRPHVSRMRGKHRENRQMRKTERCRSCCEPQHRQSLSQFELLRGIHTTDFLGCECDVSVSLITVVSAIEG